MIRMTKRLWDELEDARKLDYELLREGDPGDGGPGYVELVLRPRPKP